MFLRRSSLSASLEEGWEESLVFCRRDRSCSPHPRCTPPFLFDLGRHTSRQCTRTFFLQARTCPRGCSSSFQEVRHFLPAEILSDRHCTFRFLGGLDRSLLQPGAVHGEGWTQGVAKVLVSFRLDEEGSKCFFLSQDFAYEIIDRVSNWKMQ
jgi:hypothetical protein